MQRGKMVIVSVGLEWMWQILFAFFDILEEDEIEDCFTEYYQSVTKYTEMDKWNFESFPEY